MNPSQTNHAELIQRIQAGLSRVRPYLQEDGGDIEFVELTDDLVAKVRFKGACVACPMSLQTFKAGVEQTLKNVAPELKEIVNLTSEEIT
ncbi:MAG: NifU family protein [Bacteroidales bacterium]|nr:NifU family protein [Bacteroidales bacterium]